MFNSFVMGWVVIIGGILLAGGILYGILDAKLSREKFFNELKSSNFSIDHLMPGTVLVAFDDSKRQIAFVARDGIFKFSYGSIGQWSLRKIERNGVHISDQIHFRINDPRHPLIMSELRGGHGEFWHAKIDAIFNR